MVILSYGESMNQIKGILFDSGDTLVRPKAGSWFPKQHFIDPLEARGIRDARMDTFDEALVLGLRYLDDNHYLAADEKIERSQFRSACRLILEALGVESPSEMLISDILRPFDEEVGIEPFPDTLPTLTELRDSGIKLGIVSDNWPSLDRRYRELGLRDFFDAFVISSLVGRSKPSARMYRVGIAEIGLEPQSLMFVDDSVENVKAAMNLGMVGMVIARYQRIPETDLPVAPAWRK